MMIGIKKQVPQLKITANIASLIKQMNQQHAYKKRTHIAPEYITNTIMKIHKMRATNKMARNYFSGN